MSDNMYLVALLAVLALMGANALTSYVCLLGAALLNRIIRKRI